MSHIAWLGLSLIIAPFYKIVVHWFCEVSPWQRQAMFQKSRGKHRFAVHRGMGVTHVYPPEKLARTLASGHSLSVGPRLGLKIGDPRIQNYESWLSRKRWILMYKLVWSPDHYLIFSCIQMHKVYIRGYIVPCNAYWSCLIHFQSVD